MSKIVRTEAASKETKKCPTCGNKYLVATGYCLTCKKKVGKKEDVINVPEEFQIPGTDIILEAGDQISIVEASGDIKDRIMKENVDNKMLATNLGKEFKYMDIGEMLAVMIQAYALGNSIRPRQAKTQLINDLEQFLPEGDELDAYF